MSITNLPNLQIFGLWEETGAPGENHIDRGRTCKLHIDNHPRLELNTGPQHCKAAVLTTVPLLYIGNRGRNDRVYCAEKNYRC